MTMNLTCRHPVPAAPRARAAAHFPHQATQVLVPLCQTHAGGGEQESIGGAGGEVDRIQAIAHRLILRAVARGLDVVLGLGHHQRTDAESPPMRKEDGSVALVLLLLTDLWTGHKKRFQPEKKLELVAVSAAGMIVGGSEATVSLHDHLRQLPVVTIGVNDRGDSARTRPRDRGSAA